MLWGAKRDGQPLRSLRAMPRTMCRPGHGVITGLLSVVVPVNANGAHHVSIEYPSICWS